MVPLTETEYTQQEIDADVEKHQAEIMKHQIAISALRYKRNRLAFISRLPSEILSRIIALAKIARDSRNLLAWIQVTHVSAHWREVAINSPTLWNDPPLGKVEWQQEMLRRSKTASLTIETDLSHGPVSSKKSGLQDILRHHGSRIQHLTIESLDPEYLKILEASPVSSPRLESLFLSGCKLPNNTWGDVYVLNRILADLKNLREIKLHSLPGLNMFRWDLFFLSGITLLEFKWALDGTKLSWRQLMGALENMTKLERLDLSSVLDSPKDEDDMLSLGLVRLQHLKSLTVASSTQGVEIFFRHVTFPPRTTIEVDIDCNTANFSSITNIISNIAAQYSSSSPGSKFKSLSMVAVNFRCSFELFRENMENISDTKQNHPALSLTIKFLHENIVPTTAAFVTREIFRLSGGSLVNEVSHVRLDRCSVDSDTLACTIGTLPALSCIVVQQPAVALIKALCFSNNTAGVLSFPNLASITLDRMSFTGTSREVAPENNLDLELLKDCIKQRRVFGAEITKLVVQTCRNLKPSDVLELQAIVAHVEWDGKEQVPYPDYDSDSDDLMVGTPWWL